MKTWLLVDTRTNFVSPSTKKAVLVDRTTNLMCLSIETWDFVDGMEVAQPKYTGFGSTKQAPQLNPKGYSACFMLVIECVFGMILHLIPRFLMVSRAVLL